MKNWKTLTTICILLASIALVSADYSIDISGLKDSYSVGEEISYKILLLENGQPTGQDIQVTFSDDLETMEIKQTVKSNQDNTLKVEENFSSLGWHIKANFEEKKVTRPFIIKENSEVEFSIENGKLIIKNKGNVRYTRTVKIKIGDQTESYTQNIPINGEKKWVLIAPEGSYNIEITDGVNTFTKKNVQLTSVGTGNVVGAMSDDMQITGFLGAPIDPDSLDEALIVSDKSYIVLVFIVAVFGLGVLLLIEKKIKRTKN